MIGQSQGNRPPKPELPAPPTWDGKPKVIVGVPSKEAPPHINPITEPQRRG